MSEDKKETITEIDADGVADYLEGLAKEIRSMGEPRHGCFVLVFSEGGSDGKHVQTNVDLGAYSTSPLEVLLAMKSTEEKLHNMPMAKIRELFDDGTEGEKDDA